MWVPGRAVKSLFGEMGRETFLASQKTEPVKLKRAGFEWRSPELDPALRAMLRGARGPVR
jgi:NAD dependent epimerase/dehydratase family enzyme